VAQTKVVFVELNIQNKFRHTCDIVEKFYNSKKTLSIFVENSKNANTLDRQLWVWKQELFIPHILTNDFDQDFEEPVLITNNKNLSAVSKALVLFDPIPNDIFNNFEIVIDFAETYDPDRLQLSRKRYKDLRDSESFELHFFKLGAFLRTFQL